MATIGGLSTSTSSSIFGGGNGIGGLASGMDTDSIIEGMTLKTRAKIAKQKQDKQLLEWMSQDFRDITSKLIGFQKKFTDYTSDTNLRSPSFFEKNIITAIGDNSKYVSVSGKSPAISHIQIAGVEQTAQNTTYVSSNAVSSQELAGMGIDFNEKVETSHFAGKTLSFKYNNQSYSITLPTDGDYSSKEKINEAIKTELDKINVGSDKKLSDVVNIGIGDDNKFEMSIKDDRNDTSIKDLDGTLLDLVGIDKTSTASGKDGKIMGSKDIDSSFISSAKDVTTVADNIAGKTLTFTYNGTTKSIKIPRLEDGVEAGIFVNNGSEGYSVNKDKLKEHMQKELDTAFGSGKITVEFSDKDSKTSIKFKTTTNTTDVLKIASGSDDGALKALGLSKGQSNRVNVNTSVANSGIKSDVSGVNDYAIHIKNKNTGKIVTINKTVDGKEFSAETSISDIMKAINQSDAGVTVSYMETADKFSFISKEGGENSDFEIVSNADDSSSGSEKTNLGTALFGKLGSDDDSGYTKTAGRDAIIWVDFDGEGGAGPQKVTSTTNTINIEGLSITVNGTFGMKKDESGKVISGEFEPNSAVKFDAKMDTDKVTNAVKEMIDAFNEIIELSNNELVEKRNRDYKPLTEEQKKDMKEEEIKAWEEKAKAGLLFNNSELRGFTSDIRFIFSGTADVIGKLAEMGIETSTEYKENGKIKFDEAKFKAALEKDPETVKNMFTSTEKTFTDSDGNVVETKGGIMNQVYDVFEKYAATTGSPKGIFVEKAGATESSLSMMNNTLKKQMDKIDEEVKELERLLKMEKQRYQKKFTALETFISNMNSQSAWLAQQFGG